MGFRMRTLTYLGTGSGGGDGTGAGVFLVTSMVMAAYGCRWMGTWCELAVAWGRRAVARCLVPRRPRRLFPRQQPEDFVSGQQGNHARSYRAQFAVRRSSISRPGPLRPSAGPCFSLCHCDADGRACEPPPPRRTGRSHLRPAQQRKTSGGTRVSAQARRHLASEAEPIGKKRRQPRPTGERSLPHPTAAAAALAAAKPHASAQTLRTPPSPALPRPPPPPLPTPAGAGKPRRAHRRVPAERPARQLPAFRARRALPRETKNSKTDKRT